MTGHLREQIIIRNHARNLGDMTWDRIQHTIDEFNDFTRSGKAFTKTTKNGKTVTVTPEHGWTSIDSATERVLRMDWTDERVRSIPPPPIPIGAIKLIDVNKKGERIMIHGKRAAMTFVFRPPKNAPDAKPRWVMKTWKYVE